MDCVALTSNCVRYLFPFSRLLLPRALLAIGISWAATAAAFASPVFINELHYDNQGADEDEAIEVAGPAGTDLSNWRVVIYNGKTGQVRSESALSGVLADQANGFGTFVLSLESGALANRGPQGVALVAPDGSVAQLLSYEGSFTALDGPAAGLRSVDIGVAEPGNTRAGESLQLVGSGSAAADFLWSGPQPHSYGSPNAGQSFSGQVPQSGCPDLPADQTLVSIPAIQGVGSRTELEGQVVTVEGVVTGDFQGENGLKGFFIQDAVGDGDSKTSDGLFVEHADTEVAEGQHVRIVATAGERFQQTVLGEVQSLDVCGPGPAIAATVMPLPLAEGDNLERFEGMLITVPGPITVTDTAELKRFGSVTVAAEGRVFAPTKRIDGVDREAIEAARDDARRRVLILDDGSYETELRPVPYTSPQGSLRVGAMAESLTGTLAFAFGAYRLHPIDDVEFETTARRPVPESVNGNVKVTTFNVLNYFTTLGARGAKTPLELERQRQKIVAALRALDADLIALVEVENNGDVATGNLVGHLNAAIGESRYAFAGDPAFVGDDAIKNALLYRVDRLEMVGDPLSADPTNNPAYAVFDRPPVAQTFRPRGGGEIFGVVVNHFKSKRCSNAPASGPDANDAGGAGCWNGLRTQQARALLTFLGELTVATGTEQILVTGDFNAYAKESPILTLLDGGLVDVLSGHVPEADRYSYVFDGASGEFDYAFATASLAAAVTGGTIWHINADEPKFLEYRDAEALGLFSPDPYRSSDHDPTLVGLEFDFPDTPTDGPPDDYYAAAEGLTGEALRAALNGIIRGHTAHDYGTVWEILMEADEDPNNPHNVIEFYTRRSIAKSDRVHGGNTPDFWNREHIWPKSHGFPSRSADAHRDAHQLRAADMSVNADRGNLDFDAGGTPHHECTQCRLDDDSWEPPDGVKGETARMVFYMDVRYEGADGGTPDLRLVDEDTGIGEPRLGHLCTLIDWHQSEPVGESERLRNDVIFQWQGNRNPFIDHPEWVADVWRGQCGL